MRGRVESQGLLWDSDVLCGGLFDDGGFLAGLGSARGSVLCDADFDLVCPSGRGRLWHPPWVMAALLLVQLFYGVSDREAERRSRLDLSWKAALGLRLDYRGVPHACLVEFRVRLLRCEMEGFLHGSSSGWRPRLGWWGPAGRWTRPGSPIRCSPRTRSRLSGWRCGAVSPCLGVSIRLVEPGCGAAC